MFYARNKMGRVKVVLEKKIVSKPELNNRFTVELCENVHVHYRNLRLEFAKDEFRHILKLLKNINEDDIQNFHFSSYSYKELVKDFNLPNETYYDNRLQIELQEEGHYHIHYRNLRIELNRLADLGIRRLRIPEFKNYVKIKYIEIKRKFVETIYNRRPAECVLKNKRAIIDNNWQEKNLVGKYVYTYKVTRTRLKNLRCLLFAKEGVHNFALTESPAYKYMDGDKQSYVDYCNFKNPIGGGDVHSIERFDSLIESLNVGYDTNHVIILNENNEIIDGMHRACWLLNKYGGNYKVRILKLWYA